MANGSHGNGYPLVKHWRASTTALKVLLNKIKKERKKKVLLLFVAMELKRVASQAQSLIVQVEESQC